MEKPSNNPIYILAPAVAYGDVAKQMVANFC